MCILHNAYSTTADNFRNIYHLFSQSYSGSVGNKELCETVQDTKANNKHLSSIYFYAQNSAKDLGHMTQKTACLRNERGQLRLLYDMC